MFTPPNNVDVALSNIASLATRMDSIDTNSGSLAARTAALEAATTDLQAKNLFVGSYTIATLPAPSANNMKFAYVTDLGGGAGFVISNGTNWKLTVDGKIKDAAVAPTVNITPLVNSNLIQLTGTINAASTVRVLTTNLYDGYQAQINAPAGVLGLLGSLGVATPTGISLPLLSGTWTRIEYDATNNVFKKISGGSL